MKKGRDNFKVVNASGIFLLVYIFPLLLNFLQKGPNLIGDLYQNQISYIESIDQIFIHLHEKIFIYLNFLTNPIFWFFVSAFLTQKTIKWINS